MQLGVSFTAAHAAEGRHGARYATLGVIMAAAIWLAGCNPTTTQLAARDPADPAAPVPGVGYRSTIAPYTSLRPATPAPWRERNEEVAPKPRNGREQQ
jgi:hypothetical protein